MDEDDSIGYSHQKLQSLLQLSNNKDVTVKNYIKSVTYHPVKDFQNGLEWFNVSEPLFFSKHLKGKVVLLDFFTYCCINCMHILPDLKDLENEFSVEDGLVVVGVHSAKFENEKKSKNILAAVQRYNITHPVVNDHQMTMWENCDVHCWPTLLLLGPNANPLVMLTGEGHKEHLHFYIKNALEYYKDQQKISNHKIPLKLACHSLIDINSPLLFPGKIASCINEDVSLEHLAVSDTGNHRILFLKNDGTLLKQIGSGNAGFKDGNFQIAEFNAPQGLVFDGKDVIFVADTENHAIRKLDLQNEIVKTVAGTGFQGNDYKGGRKGKVQEISSPWDVCIYNITDEKDSKQKKVLMIAMAGTHQIWALFLDDTVWWKNQSYSAGTCVAIAGSGREENRNNQYPHAAGFAQPSGLAIHSSNKEIYIADSESSSIRRLSLLDGKVTCVVGGDKNPNNLFAFGDKDGKLQEAKLQHLLGLALANKADILFAADTYNHKLKRVDITTNTIYTLSVAGLNEPGGVTVSFDDKKLYVADTNNHCIKIVTLDDKLSAVTTTTLELNMSQHPLKLSELAAAMSSKVPTYNSKTITISEKGGKLKLKFNFNFVKGLKLNPESVQKWSVKSPNKRWFIAPTSGNNINNIDIICKVSGPHLDKDNLDCFFHLVTCTDEFCIPKKFVIRQPLLFQEGAPSTLESILNVEVDPLQILIIDKLN
ncbi:NHL repeat-containing protein 2 isoform X2 [Agrilus planipennis]|nr:NHL repeat-containing protein 2 isoform X2 [Agrilus planipennis]